MAHTIISHLKKNPLQWTVQIIGAIVVILNLWLASKLFPLVGGIDANASRISALEKRNESADVLIPRFIVAEEKVNSLENNLTKIENTVIRIETKIDRLIELRG